MSQAGRQHEQRRGGGKGQAPEEEVGWGWGTGLGVLQAMILCLGSVQQTVGNPRGRWWKRSAMWPDGH